MQLITVIQCRKTWGSIATKYNRIRGMGLRLRNRAKSNRVRWWWRMSLVMIEISPIFIAQQAPTRTATTAGDDLDNILLTVHNIAIWRSFVHDITIWKLNACLVTKTTLLVPNSIIPLPNILVCTVHIMLMCNYSLSTLLEPLRVAKYE